MTGALVVLRTVVRPKPGLHGGGGVGGGVGVGAGVVGVGAGDGNCVGSGVGAGVGEGVASHAVAPSVRAWRPAAQCLHSTALSPDCHCPTAHSTHSALERCKLSDENCPGKHGRQLVAAGSG